MSHARSRRYTPRRRYSVDSLGIIAMEVIIKNMSFYQNSGFEALKQLPIPIKNRLIKKLTASCRNSGDVRIDEFVGALVNKYTTEMNLSLFNVTDNLLDKFCVCEKMKTITWFGDRIGGCDFTPAGLIKFLKHTRELTMLTLIESDKVNDEVLECLSNNCQKLEVIEIAGSQNVTDEGLMHLNSMNISTLSINKTNITDMSLIALANGKINQTLKEVVVKNCDNITHLGLNAIAKNCPNLISFNIMSNKNVDAANIDEIVYSMRPFNQVFYDLDF